MHRNILALSTAAILLFSAQFAFADGDGAVTGAVGGAVAGAVVGGPVGAVVGAGAGAVIGGGASGPDHRVIVVQPIPTPPIEPCNMKTTQTTDSNGNSSTTRVTNCPN